MKCEQAQFQQQLLSIEETLNKLIKAKPEALQAILFAAARYSLLAPGKRLRPLLAIITAGSYGVSLEPTLHPACALELIHTYSLIHDDLPCMDNDELRRGRPTLHKIYGDGPALLAGDFLLTFAFQVLAECPELSSDQKIQLISVLAKRSGAEGMIGGQVVDLAHEGQQIEWPTLHFMHTHKTAALITAALEFGAIIGNAPATDKTLLSRIGQELGLAFQIIDDWLDVTGNPAALGKNTLSDLKKQKPTAITLLGLNEGKEYADHLLDSALKKISQLSIPADELKVLAQKLVYRSY